MSSLHVITSRCLDIKDHMSKTCVLLQHGNISRAPAMQWGQTRGSAKATSEAAGVGSVWCRCGFGNTLSFLPTKTGFPSVFVQQLMRWRSWISPVTGRLLHCVSPGCISRFPSPLSSKGSSWRLLHRMLFPPCYSDQKQCSDIRSS